ncbi:TIM-barrel domain-containing protein [Flavobacterium sp. '19STA2R22 D10 B1']|uniref:glycoside hydrolase family 31 protein n=1 Tax=Flavobacterium aerium TaxID=3037261 RepID=UPI00278BDD52|nr:TIM-barrel domain-containing protein [Flavobacterium sp. '19STA2R22 D10 B1']
MINLNSILKPQQFLYLVLGLVLCAGITELKAQNANRKFEDFKTENGYLEITTNEGTYHIKAYSEAIIETSFIPKGETFNPLSHAVVLQPESNFAKIKATKSKLEYVTKGMVVTIEKNPFKISYSYKNKFLLSEKKGYIQKDSVKQLEFNLESSEVLYGGGARVLGMNRRGNRLQLYNKAHYGYETHSELMNFTLPIVMSSKIYTVHFDNAPIGYLDLDSKKDNTLTYETISGRMTYQVIAADTWKELVHNYVGLTGKQPLLPRWALGNFSSRFGYHSEKETRATVAKFQAEKIPLDAIILDLYWFGKEVKGTMGNLAFSRDSFPEPEKMMADFNEKGVKTILITEPFILTTSNRWKEAVDEKVLATDKFGKPFTYDFFFGNTGLIDLFKSEARNWFWDIYKDLNKQGVAGWWGDLGEPEVHPSALRHATGTADEVHNIYGHEWAKLVFEGYQKDFSNQRPFILMRSGYSGSQRFGLIPWSGDVSRSWGGLQPQTEIALQMGMQGLGYMHSDLGGFAGSNLDNELYTRWLQYGVFQPIYRPHAQEEVASEPVFKEGKTKALAKKAIELRYQLLPYNYTIAFENNQKGTPLMRPLFFDEPNNATALLTADTYLWGNEFLVSPIVKAGITQQEVYFPAKNNWFDFYSGKKHEGGTKQTVAVVADHIPVFVRGGAFIPMISTIQSTKEYTLKKFQLHYYYDATVTASEGNLYDDDGLTPDAYEKGQFEYLHFKSNTKKNNLAISLQGETGAHYTGMNKEVKLIIHNVAQKPRKVTVAKKEESFTWNATENTVEITLSWTKDTVQDINFEWSK